MMRNIFSMPSSQLQSISNREHHHAIHDNRDCSVQDYFSSLLIRLIMFIDVYRVNDAQFQHFVHVRNTHTHTHNISMQSGNFLTLCFCQPKDWRSKINGSLILGHEADDTLAKIVNHSRQLLIPVHLFTYQQLRSERTKRL